MSNKSRKFFGIIKIYKTIGGRFFVYVLWEAKAQYTEPFFMFLIPMAACGAERIADLLDRIADGGNR